MDTLPVPPLLRTRLALATLVGVFLIPIGLSSMRGITHALTCREPVEAPFQVILEPGSPPIVTGAMTLEPGDPGTLCGGLLVDLLVSVADDETIEVAIPVTNGSDADWRGTVQLVVASTRIPIDLGRVDAGETRRPKVDLRLPEGTAEFDVTLLIGP